MLIPKLWYLLYFSGQACIFPFFPLLFRRAALTLRQIGVLQALKPWAGLPGGWVWSGVADTWRLHKAILFATLITSVALRLAVLAQSTFTAMLVFILLGESATTPVTIIVDAAVMAGCAAEGEYGQYRLWGAVGWGTFSVIGGALISGLGVEAVVGLCVALSLATLVPSAYLSMAALNTKLEAQQQTERVTHDVDEHEGCGADDGVRVDDELLLDAGENPRQHHNHHQQQQQQQQQPEYWRGLAELGTNPEALIFFAIALTYGFCVGNIESFLFLYLEDLGARETLMGLTLTFTCISESAVFYWAGPIVSTLGPSRCFHAIFAAFLLRMASYATLASWPSLWLILPVELLHGLTFGLTWAVGAAYCNRLSPPGLEATTQGLFQGLYLGAGAGVGGMVGGVLYGSVGPQAMYAAACVVLVLGWVGTSTATHWWLGDGKGRVQYVAVGEERVAGEGMIRSEIGEV